MKRPSLKSLLYTKRVKLSGYRSPVTAIGTHSQHDAAAIFRRIAPELTKADHKALAHAHYRASTAFNKLWDKVADRASKETFGRPFGMGDYKISGIGRDEFPARYKNILRMAAHSSGDHSFLAHAHRHAAKYNRK